MKRFQGPQGEFRIRTRFVVAVAQRSPLVYKVRVECERADNADDWQPWTRPFVEDARLVEELQARLAANGPRSPGLPRVQPGSEAPEPVVPGFCESCGALVTPDARFCSGCGQKLSR